MNAADMLDVRQVEEMLGLLSRQVSLCDELQNLIGKQQSLVSTEDTQPLLKLLGHRRRITDELAQVSRLIVPFRESWERTRPSLSSDLRDRVEGMVTRVNEGLKTILSGDERDARMLQLRKQEVGQKLGASISNRVAIAAYRSCGRQTGSLDQTHIES